MSKNNLFSIRLKHLRKVTGINQQQLGEYLGYGYTTISNYERKYNEPSIDDLIRIADYFNVSVDYLIGHDFNRKNPTYIP